MWFLGFSTVSGDTSGFHMDRNPLIYIKKSKDLVKNRKHNILYLKKSRAIAGPAFNIYLDRFA